MTVLRITKEPEAVLRTPAKAVPKVTKAIRKLIADMIETMHHADGVGIAAPQVDVSLQIFIACSSREPGSEIVAVNPSLEVLDTEPHSLQEGCLSLPHVWSPLERPTRVRLRALNAKGKPFVKDASGLLATIFQHEYDHLQGMLFVDRLPNWQRDRLLEKYKESQ